MANTDFLVLDDKAYARLLKDVQKLLGEGRERVTKALKEETVRAYWEVGKRIAAIRAVQNDFPQQAWELLLSLLPRARQTTSGSHKPKWRNPLP